MGDQNPAVGTYSIVVTGSVKSDAGFVSQAFNSSSLSQTALRRLMFKMIRAISRMLNLKDFKQLIATLARAESSFSKS